MSGQSGAPTHSNKKLLDFTGCKIWYKRMIKKFPFHKQADHKDCGATCLKIISKYYKKTIPLQQLREISETQRSGSSLLGLSNAAENIGFRSLGVKVTLNDIREVPLPCILHWNKNHYVVL